MSAPTNALETALAAEAKVSSPSHLLDRKLCVHRQHLEGAYGDLDFVCRCELQVDLQALTMIRGLTRGLIDTDVIGCIWPFMEVSVAIYCACPPTVAALAAFMRQIRQSRASRWERG